MRILGVDISPSVGQKKYFAVVLENDTITFEDEVSRFKLIRLIRSLKPDIVACDNIFELFDKDEIKRFLLILPEKTKLVQVNGTYGTQKPLHIVAKEHGIHITAKASAREEALACAMLARKGVGYVVSMFENEVKIIVSRARSVGKKGGQSRERFMRKVHGYILNVVRGIKAKLDEKKLEYTLEVRKADGGLARGVFTVKASKKELGIKNYRGSDVQIKVKPIISDKLSFTPLNENKNVIVGIDPGTTTAVAVIDENGDLIEVKSSKNMSINDIVEILGRYRVMVCATDVNPAPRSVEKLASILNAELFTPSSTLSVSEKVSLVVDRFSKVYKNAHERDAIAAAIKAFNVYKSKIEEKKRKIRVKKVEEKAERDESKNEKKDESKEDELIKTYTETIKRLKEEISALKRENRELKEIIAKKDYEIKELKRKINEIKDEAYREILKSREIEIKNKEISYLKSKLAEEKALREAIQKELNEIKRAKLAEKKNYILIKIISKFTREEVFRARKRIKEKDIIYIVDSSGGSENLAREIKEMNPRALIADIEKMSHLAREELKDVVLINPSEVKITILEKDFGIAQKEEIEKIIEKKAKKLEERKRICEEKKLISLIQEYREERRKEFIS